jgi:hypothetical protein
MATKILRKSRVNCWRLVKKHKRILTSHHEHWRLSARPRWTTVSHWRDDDGKPSFFSSQEGTSEDKGKICVARGQLMRFVIICRVVYMLSLESSCYEYCVLLGFGMIFSDPLILWLLSHTFPLYFLLKPSFTDLSTSPLAGRSSHDAPAPTSLGGAFTSEVLKPIQMPKPIGL